MKQKEIRRFKVLAFRVYRKEVNAISYRMEGPTTLPQLDEMLEKLEALPGNAGTDDAYKFEITTKDENGFLQIRNHSFSFLHTMLTRRRAAIKERIEVEKKKGPYIDTLRWMKSKLQQPEKIAPNG